MNKKAQRGISGLRKRKPDLNHIKLIDSTNTLNPKRFIVVVKNLSGESTSSDIVWRDVVTRVGDIVNINYARPLSVQATLLTNPPKPSPQLGVFSNERYFFNNNYQLVYETGSGSGSVFDIHNNTSFNANINVCRDGYVYASVLVSAADTYSFEFRPTIFVGIYDDLNAVVDISTLNTELSLLGVKTADVVATGSPSSYSFSLTNVTF